MSKYYGISYTVLQGDPYQTPTVVVNITPQGSADGSHISFRIQHQLPFTIPQGLPIKAQLSDQQHDELKSLIHQPNKLFNRFKEIVLADNPAGFRSYIEWFFDIAKVAVIKEIIRQLRLPQPPPPPPPLTDCGCN